MSARGIVLVATMMLVSASRTAAWRPSPLLMGRRLRSLSMQASGDGASPKEFGFVGLGYMGNGMVRRLLGQGNKVVVWNRSVEKSAALQKEFPEHVSVAPTPRAVVERTGVTFSMLSTPEAARAVFYGDNGVLAGVSSGKGLVDCATLEVKDMVEFSDAVRGKGGRFVEAPVSGSKVPAETGQLIFLMGGDKGLADEVAPQLGVMGKAAHFLGDVGKGTEMKLVVNMVMGSMMASLGEGLSLASASGLDASALITILDQGAMSNPMFRLKGPKIIANDHAPNFPLKHQSKDMDFALRLGKQVGAPLHVASAATQRYHEAIERGEGDLDFSAVASQWNKKP